LSENDVDVNIKYLAVNLWVLTDWLKHKFFCDINFVNGHF
jgi:hypothetical protein